jgi:hypothetical protein
MYERRAIICTSSGKVYKNVEILSMTGKTVDRITVSTNQLIITENESR